MLVPSTRRPGPLRGRRVVGLPAAGDPPVAEAAPSKAVTADLADGERALDQARRGDEAGYRWLWRALQPRLLRYLTVRGAVSPEDVASETWLHVVKDLAGFTGGYDDFRAWLFTVARNRNIDAARASARRPAVSVADVTTVAAASLEPSAEHGALELAGTQTAIRLVMTLPADQAEMVMLRVVADLDVATVAAVVGKSPGAVRVAVHRGLRALARRPEVAAVADRPESRRAAR